MVVERRSEEEKSAKTLMLDRGRRKKHEKALKMMSHQALSDLHIVLSGQTITGA